MGGVGKEISTDKQVNKDDINIPIVNKIDNYQGSSKDVGTNTKTFLGDKDKPIKVEQGLQVESIEGNALDLDLLVDSLIDISNELNKERFKFMTSKAVLGCIRDLVESGSNTKSHWSGLKYSPATRSFFTGEPLNPTVGFFGRYEVECIEDYVMNNYPDLP